MFANDKYLNESQKTDIYNKKPLIEKYANKYSFIRNESNISHIHFENKTKQITVIFKRGANGTNAPNTSITFDDFADAYYEYILYLAGSCILYDEKRQEIHQRCEIIKQNMILEASKEQLKLYGITFA